MKQIRLLAILLAVSIFSTGCIKPYMTPLFEEVKNEETAFVIPLEGETSDQAKLQSIDYLEAKKVASKRIEIPQAWVKTGRLPNSGVYRPMVLVIKVSRSPMTVLWEANVDDGKKQGQGIWIESGDSVGFSMGFNCTAQVLEEDTAKFLYYYKGDSLQAVLNTEVKARYQQVAANFAAGFILDDLRSKKAELAKAIEDDVVPFYKNRGITITAVGMFGGMTYENIEIQQSIDKVFVSQQEKQVAKALLEAQNDKNKRIELEALATAEKRSREAKGEADAKLLVATAEAAGIDLINKALSGSGDGVIKIKTIDAIRDGLKIWNGQLPVWLMTGGSQSPEMLLNIDPPNQTTSTK